MQPLNAWQDFTTKLGSSYRQPARNPRWLLMFGVSRLQIIRAGLRRLAPLPASHLALTSSSLFEPLPITAAVEALKRDGLFQGLRLPPPLVQEVLDFAYVTPCYGDGDLRFPFKYVEKEAALARYQRPFSFAKYFNTGEACQAIRQLAADAQLRAIAAGYLQAQPVHTGNRCWWNFAAPAGPPTFERGSHQFHYDLDDYRSVRFFFYLTEVDATSGPHQYVRGSHRQKRLRHQLSLHRQHSDAEIVAYYGPDRLVPIYGPAGYGFAEDTYCFHRGLWPHSRDRLMLQIQFATHDYGVQHDQQAPPF